MAIKTFGDRRTARVFDGEVLAEFSAELCRRAKMRLDYINIASHLGELRIPPSNRLEKLRGDLSDWYSIRINKQWRIIFHWHDNDAFDVEIIDYH